MRKKIILCILIVCIIAAASVAAIIYQNHAGRGGTIAKVYQNGQCIRTIDLSAVSQPWEFTITGADGAYNTVRVEPGRIAIIDASCPDGICVDTGYISDGLKPITCLPNKVIIRIEGGSGSAADGWSV